jgi:hypothetical protein
MVTFVAISRHNAEVCAFHDEKSAKTMIDWLKKAKSIRNGGHYHRRTNIKRASK